MNKEARRKTLCVSLLDSKHNLEGQILEYVSWMKLDSVNNFADYDQILINFNANNKTRETEEMIAEDFEHENSLFERNSWYQIIKNNGRIICVGIPDYCPFIHYLFGIDDDRKKVDLERVSIDRTKNASVIERYLAASTNCNVSLRSVVINPEWNQWMAGRSIYANRPDRLGATRFDTFLAVRFSFVGSKAEVWFLPTLGREVDDENDFVLKEILEVPLSRSAPKWVDALLLPGDVERRAKLTQHRQELDALQVAIQRGEIEFREERRWYRLLYEDGHNLEDIVKEALELLDANVESISKEKADFHLTVQGFAKGIMEIKGTHNATFAKGALTQLSGWMDEALADGEDEVKGIFVGNSDRKNDPENRGVLFEENNLRFARMKKMTLIRTVDLLCFVILKKISSLDVSDLWQQIFACEGPFDASAYHDQLPPDLKLIR